MGGIETGLMSRLGHPGAAGDGDGFTKVVEIFWAQHGSQRCTDSTLDSSA